MSDAVRPNSTKTLEFGAQKGLLQGPARRWVAHALKTPTPRELSAKPFYRKGEGGTWLVVADFLVSDPLFLRSGHHVPINL